MKVNQGRPSQDHQDSYQIACCALSHADAGADGSGGDGGGENGGDDDGGGEKDDGACR
jgi:hypothetical protein